MTWPPKIPWWVSPLAILVAVLAVVWALNGRRGLSRELAAEKERRTMELAELNVAHQVERDALTQDLIGEATASAKLAEELARIQAVTPGAKPIATVHGSTPWKPVGPAAGGSGTPSPPAETSGTTPPVPASPSCPPCRLWVGDEVRVKASGAGVMTSLGNVAVAGVASVWRRQPGDKGEGEKFHDEPLKLDVKILDQGAGPGWGAGAVVVGGRSGWWVGPLASPPPIRLWGLEAALIVGAGVGGGGEWGGLAGGLLRW